MKKDINSNNEELVDKVFKILTKFKNSPKKIENIFTELFEKDFDAQLNEISQLENGLLKGLIISVKDLFDVKGYITRGGTKFLKPDISYVMQNVFLKSEKLVVYFLVIQI